MTLVALVIGIRVDGIFIAKYEQGVIGEDLFQAACNMGFEGIVSKRRDRSYDAGKCKHWIKVKNPAHPAYSRVRESLRQSLRSRRSA
jgi:bifunctional non-homologous end joining protein LigD